ncbi:MoaF N-terminal domain-containing protein [Flavobacterium sp. DGU38]|uniref:MoaF N-terminal domain-containing protein n=1 Tax=Flavobacterium calami TaxID=3139144 RepID=A0ABU9INX3_9FLAO
MNKKNLTLILLSLIIFSSCSNKEKQDQNKTEKYSKKTEISSLIGKKAILTYTEFKAEVNYISDTEIHWKTTDSKGVLTDGYEKISYKRLNENLYFLNWIEKDGYTVSQIIDTKNKTVNTFASFNDDKSLRGKRNSAFLLGKFEIIE